MKLINETTENCRNCLFIADPENFCYKMDKYLNHDINAIHPDCPLPDAEEEFCEWKLVPSYIVGEFNYKTSCKYTIGQFSKADYKFCPNCGKPIKIKETK